MSLGLIPIFQPEDASSFDELGEVLAHEYEMLERLADDAGITPLSTFADQREVPPDFDGSPEDLEELIGACNDWYDASMGAAAVSRIIDRLSFEETLAGELGDREPLLKELYALKVSLERAAKNNAKFRLGMV